MTTYHHEQGEKEGKEDGQQLVFYVIDKVVQKKSGHISCYFNLER
jgi:hypothetical protein